MLGDLKRFVAHNLPPIGVLVCVIIALVLVAQFPRVVEERRGPVGGGDASASSSPTWRALPMPGATLQRIGFASCFGQDRPAPIWRAIVAAKPDVFLMMGDNVYGDVKSPDLRELRGAYGRLATHPDFLPAVKAFPFLATWDDHDYGRNDGDADFAHRDGSRALFRAFWKGSGSIEDAPAADGIYYSRAFGPAGRRVQIIMLDGRSYRSPLSRAPRVMPGRRGYQPDDSPDKTMLGSSQWVWLKSELEKPADLRLIVSGVQVIADGHAFERWGNLPRERQRLYDLIRTTKASGVVFLSGDRHRAGIYRNGTASAYPLYEITSSSLNRPFDDPNERGPHQIGRMFGGANFGLLTIDWDARTVQATVRDVDGKAVRTLDVKLDALRAF